MNKKIKEQYREEFLSLLNEWEFGKGSISISESPTFLGEIHIHIVFSFNYDKNILTQIEKKYLIKQINICKASIYSQQELILQLWR